MERHTACRSHVSQMLCAPAAIASRTSFSAFALRRQPYPPSPAFRSASWTSHGSWLSAACTARLASGTRRDAGLEEQRSKVSELRNAKKTHLSLSTYSCHPIFCPFERASSTSCSDLLATWLSTWRMPWLAAARVVAISPFRVSPSCSVPYCPSALFAHCCLSVRPRGLAACLALQFPASPALPLAILAPSSPPPPPSLLIQFPREPTILLPST